jgi:glycerol-3-phosphate cytidylyltransferase
METVGYTIGVYDLFHVGHLRHLLHARERCARLIVGVIGDDDAERRYGTRPFIPAAERMDLLASLGCVDDVCVARGVTVASAPDPDLPRTPVDYDLLLLGTDPDVPFGLGARDAGGVAVPVIELPGVRGTASTILRAALTRSPVA